MTDQNLTLALVHNGVVSQSLLLPAKGDAARIHAVAGNRYLIADADAKNTGPELLVAKRMSNALALGAPDDDGPRLIIDDYYLYPGDVIGQAENGNVHVYINENEDEPHTGDFTDGDAAYLIPDSVATEGFTSQPISEYSYGAMAAFAGLIALSGGLYALQNKHSAAEKKPIQEPENTAVAEETGSSNAFASGGIIDEMTQPINGTPQADELAILLDDILANAEPELFHKAEDESIAVDDSQGEEMNVIDVIPDSAAPHDFNALSDVACNGTIYQTWYCSTLNSELAVESCINVNN